MVRFSKLVLPVVVLAVLTACSSSKPIRFQFQAPEPLEIEIDDGPTHVGTNADVFMLASEDAGKRLTLRVGDRTWHGRMDVYSNTQTTRLGVVPVQINPALLRQLEGTRAATLVIYQRRRDIVNPPLGTEDATARVYDYGDTVTRDALLEHAGRQGAIIAVIDLAAEDFWR